MSDQSKKNIYLCARICKFLEKEVYELTHLDYFIYLLINDLSSLLENKFFSGYKENDAFRLSKEEIATMSFNVGDSLQIFLDKNCFGGCNLGCPNKLSKPFSKEDDEVRNYFVTKEFDGVTASCTNREDCLYHDVKNYVVSDVLLDFYNYEMGLVLHEKDRKLGKLTELVMNHIIVFTRYMGPKLLTHPTDLAGEMFEKHLQTDETSWDEPPEIDADDEEDAPEAWKVDQKSLNNVFNDFEDEYPEIFTNRFSKKLLQYFKTFLDDYLEVNKINEIEFEYIDEYFSMLLLQNFIMDEDVNFAEVEKIFSQFFSFVDQQFLTNLSVPFKSFALQELQEIKRAFFLTQKYQQENPYINYLLNLEDKKENLLEGYYEITHWTDSELILLDVDVKTEHSNINLGDLKKQELKIGDILHLQLDTSASKWTVAYLELIYPSASKYFLY